MRVIVVVPVSEDQVDCLLRTNYWLVKASDGKSTELRVGCFCEVGRHRSVAFVEELARRKWPSDWEVEIYHRDVDQSKSKNKNQHHKQSRRENQKFVGLGTE